MPIVVEPAPNPVAYGEPASWVAVPSLSENAATVPLLDSLTYSVRSWLLIVTSVPVIVPVAAVLSGVLPISVSVPAGAIE